MSVKRMATLACAGALSALSACGGRGPGSGAPAAPQANDDGLDAEVEAAPPQPRLAPDQIRVTVLVLPGDAEVEVDGAAVRRRDGVIEVAGKSGEKRRLRVFKGSLSVEQDVTLETDGASPSSVDLLAKAAAQGAEPLGGPKAPGKSEAPVDPLLPENFE